MPARRMLAIAGSIGCFGASAPTCLAVGAIRPRRSSGGFGMTLASKTLPKSTELERLDVTVPEAARLLSMGETTIWRLIAANELESYTIGKSRRVTMEGIRA